MPEVRYGNSVIEYRFLEQPHLSSHYIVVEQGEGVVLKGVAIDEKLANRYVLKKARWILDKLKVVEQRPQKSITTGSRLPYLGRHFYTELVEQVDLSKVEVAFNQSRFIITYNPQKHSTEDITQGLEDFYREKAIEKIKPRFSRWIKASGLKPQEIKFMKLHKRWGSCTKENNIIMNTDCIKLPFKLIDYVIAHELAHIEVKDHSKDFWNRLAQIMSDYKVKDEALSRYD